jgi:hypothetical protein
MVLRRVTRRGNMGADFSQNKYFRSINTSKAMITIGASIMNAVRTFRRSRKKE